MDSFGLFLLSQLVALPVLLGIVRYANIPKDYKPFFWLLVVGLLTEEVNYIFISYFHTNAPPLKVYSLFECVIVLIQFHQWGFLKTKKKWFQLLVFTCITCWFIESIIFLGINNFSPFFRVFYSFLIVLISINEINRNAIIIHSSSLFKNAKFLICIAFIIYFTYQILDEAAYFVGKATNVLTITITSLFAYINAFVNLIYLAAIYYIPKKEQFKFIKGAGAIDQDIK